MAAQETSELNKKLCSLYQDTDASLSRIGDKLLKMVAQIQEIRDKSSNKTAEKVSGCYNEVVEAPQNLDKAPSTIRHETEFDGWSEIFTLMDDGNLE